MKIAEEEEQKEEEEENPYLDFPLHFAPVSTVTRVFQNGSQHESGWTINFIWARSLNHHTFTANNKHDHCGSVSWLNVKMLRHIIQIGLFFKKKKVLSQLIIKILVFQIALVLCIKKRPFSGTQVFQKKVYWSGFGPHDAKYYHEWTLVPTRKVLWNRLAYMHALYSILAIITDYWPVYAGVPNKVDIYLYVSNSFTHSQSSVWWTVGSHLVVFSWTTWSLILACAEELAFFTCTKKHFELKH